MSILDRPLIGVTYSSAELGEFTLWGHMFRGIVAACGIPVAIDCRLPVPHIAELVGRLDGLILSGGGDVDPSRYGGDRADPLVRGVNPARDDAELAALRRAQLDGKPVLAICRGAQLVNVALGGILYADLARDHPSPLTHRMTEDALAGPLHEVDVVPGTDLAKWLDVAGPIAVNSQHHQGIRKLAPDLVPSAYSEDGLVEAFELPDGPLMGVQWHPEVLWPTEAHSHNLLAAFVACCAG
jgi:putative glutamine amidotransferase